MKKKIDSKKQKKNEDITYNKTECLSNSHWV